MKILVTGGAGFIASHISDFLISMGNEVVIVDNLSTGKEKNINPRAKFIKMDICDAGLDKLFKEESFDIVNHHAAQIDVRHSVEDPLKDARVNILGSINLLENSVKYGVKKFIFASSGGVIYGEPVKLPASEKDTACPISPYGASKYAVEVYLNYYNSIKGLKYSILRYGNVYGPRQDPHGEAGVVAIFINALLEGRVPVIYGGGEQLRDYVYIEDVVKANVFAIESPRSNLLNIGTGVGTSVNKLFKSLTRLIPVEVSPGSGPRRDGEIQKVYLDWKKASEEIGWEPMVSMEEGLERTLAYFREERKIKA
ncbi:MAG: NAD-dependent epimerase/dehydratase family protein [Firmicutes bacterium]|nr:NAD-dependent epimerase/dehydratase family protein [Bacillota bacterium]